MTSNINRIETWDMPVFFKVREHVSGAPWLLVELFDGPTLPILDQGFLGIDLSKETTLAQARELAELLNEHVTHLTYTGPDSPAWADNPGRRARARRQMRLSSS